MTAGGVEDRIEKLEKAMRDMRRRVDETGRAQHAELGGLRYAVFACVAAGVLLALTAATWRVYAGDDPDVEDLTTLWGMAPEGWQGFGTLALVLVLVVGTIGVFLAGADGHRVYLVFAGIAALTVVAILFVGMVEPDHWYDAEDTESGPGRWLALFTALTLTITHAARGAELRR